MIKTKEFWGMNIDKMPNLDEEINKWLEEKQTIVNDRINFKLIDIKYSIMPDWKIIGEGEIGTVSNALVIYDEK